MKLVLRRPTEIYPANGGFGFVEPKTGMKFNGLHGSPQATALKIIDHRRANPNLFKEAHEFDVESVVQEIFHQKLKTMPELFIGFGGEPTQMFPQDNKCTCGAEDWDEILCASCGGRRVTGYKCRKCGKKK